MKGSGPTFAWRAVLLLVVATGGCSTRSTTREAGGADSLKDPREIHFRNVRQLTFGGENAEGYWSADGRRLVFQSNRGRLPCDQIFIMDAHGLDVRRISTGLGKSTCSFFFPDGRRILYSSTHRGSPGCPPKPDTSKGYVWRLEPDYEIWSARLDGRGLRQLTHNPGYDAEATVSADGSRIIFTSLREGDLDLYTMRPDGSEVTRITHETGYDGGAFFSPDGKRIVWRASRPQTEEEKGAYRELLAESQIRPMQLEIFLAGADGSNARQLTQNGATNFAPCFFPDGKRILFASNVASPGTRNFDLFLVRDDGTGLEQVTFSPEFDSFPMFSPDGRRLVFASNRNAKAKGETNLFVADWEDAPAP